MTSNPAYARIALTPGEPAGIGPDLAIALARRAQTAAVVCYADPAMLDARARLLGGGVQFIELADAAAATPQPAGRLQVYPVASAAAVRPGRLDPANAAYVLACLDAAVTACAEGALAALVTGPVQKSVINDAGRPFSGHTEYLAERLGARLPVMMLVSDTLRVALLTTHVALRAVPELVTGTRLEAVLGALVEGLRQRFAIAAPRIGVCGLNPHAGEDGHLGREEIEIIAPALERLRARGVDLSGPLPADTAFTAEHRARFDAILAMYHDQGLAALKAVGFGEAVNVTLGLPIVRTSVDHGTALDLAGSGRARAGSLQAALDLALTLARPPRA